MTIEPQTLASIKFGCRLVMLARVPLVAIGGWRDLIRRIGAPCKLSRCCEIPDSSMEFRKSIG